MNTELNATLAVDAILALILLWKLLQGRRQGVVKKLGGLAALVCAVWGAREVSSRFGQQISDRWLLPFVTKALERARDSLGLSSLLSDLGGVLNGASLPGFLKTDVLETVTEQLSETAATALNTAADVVAARLAGWLLFALSAVVIYAVVSILFNGILDPLIRRLPIVSGVNRTLGAILGAALGVLITALLLAVAYRLLPDLSQPGGVFSPEAVERSLLLKYYLRFLPGIFA